MITKKKLWDITIFGCTLIAAYEVTETIEKKVEKIEPEKEEIKEEEVEEEKEEKSESVKERFERHWKKFKIITKKYWNWFHDKYLDFVLYLTGIAIDLQSFTLLFSFIASVYSMRTARMQFKTVQRKVGADSVFGLLSSFAALNNVRREVA